eukprot:2391566-Pleurochrysis_carterae.AAC.1
MAHATCQLVFEFHFCGIASTADTSTRAAFLYAMPCQLRTFDGLAHTACHVLVQMTDCTAVEQILASSYKIAAQAWLHSR